MLLRIARLVLFACLCVSPTWSYNFSISTLKGLTVSGATTLQFGPDQRLYVGQVNGQIKALTVQRVSANNYQVTATEIINLVRDIPNYDDSGTRNFTLTSRQVTGLLVVGTAASPVLYVTSSDPRIGGGSGGENDLDLDTNSGVLSRLTRSGSTWTKVDLVRGLPRSEENHASNGMQLEPITNTLYLAQGGNTNAGGPSINFAYACETALSAAILSISLNALDAMPVKTDAYGQKYVYNLPTLDDPDPLRGRNGDGSNVNDPFGGNDGLNQARLVPGSPVQIYAPGFRNIYDLVYTRSPGREGRLYTFDNGANQGWGGYPNNEGPSGTVTNEYVEGEPGVVNNLDNLHFIPARGYYGGHPNPIRANPAGAGWFHFDRTQPTGSQKIFATNPTSDWPSVPVSLANPVEGDFRQPGAANGALLTVTASTNGLAEYVGTNFSGEMQGNLIAASYDGRLLRIALSPDGTAVANGLETLATGFGTLPLDVTTPDPGSGSAFVGTIWVAHYSPAKISILEPADFDSPGSSTCTGINSFDVDEDGDGYSNADEIANNSDPCSGAIRPPDVDDDKVSDLLDLDDDNDGIDDTQDPFPLDAQNGASVPMPVRYELFNDTGVGFFSVGLTGVMMNRGEDYLQRMSPDNVIAGGTAGLFTVAEAGPGLALGGSNNQKDAYQFALNSNEFTSPYTVTSRLSGPFFANTPTGNQRHGIYLGTGDQDNYISLALHANGGAGGLEVVYELGGAIVSQQMYPFSGLAGNSTVDLSFFADPVAGTVQPGYQLSAGAEIIPVGPPIHTTGAVLQSLMGSQPLAVGLFATTSGGGAPTFSATWDYFDVTPSVITSRAKVTIDPSGTNMATSSTYTSGSFKIENLSTDGQQIQNVTIDLSTAIFPDMVYDPTGTAGDQVAKGFQANSASSGVSLASGLTTRPHNGVNGQDGYDEVDITFNSFPVNGTFTFSIDCDPTSVKGVAAPGENDSASVSGLELIGSTVTIYFSDGTIQRTRLGRVENSVDGSYGWLRSDAPPQPGISFISKTSPLKSGQSPETVRVSGPAGLNVSLVTVEGALYLGGVPGGGYDIDPYESNTAIKVTEATGVISAAGYKDFSITPTKSNAAGGYNYITAVLSNASGIKGPASNPLILWYDPTFAGGDTQPPTAPGSLTAPNVTSRSITLGWSASTDDASVQRYEISRDGALVSTTLGLTYTDIGLDAGVSYDYSVVARDEAGNVSPAAEITVETPANGAVVVRNNSGGPAFVDARGNTWSADTGYNTGTTTTVTNAINRAVDDTLFKTDRIDSSATAPDLAYAFNVANGQYEVQLFLAELSTANSAVGKRVFDVVIENQLAFDNLDVFALAGAPFTAVVVAATTTVVDGQLNIAFPRGVGSPKVNAIKIIKLPAAETTPPTTPTNLKATNTTSDSVTLAWDESTDNVGVTAYVVSRNGTVIQTTPDLSVTDTGLASSTQYQYSVRAADAAGNLSPAATLSVTTLTATVDTQAPTAPGTPTFTNVTASSITVNWTAATDNVGVTGYRISRDSTELATITGLNYIDTGLTAATAYTYSIVAVDAAGNVSPASSATVSTTPGGTASSTIRVNAGGPSYVDTAGNTWSADTGYNTGIAYTFNTTVTGTPDPTLYKTSRYQPPSDPPLAYTFAMPNGDYVVRLHLSETYAGTQGVGKRVFDIDIQSVRAFDDVDIFALAGGNTALVLSKNATVTNGQMRIDFVRQVENPKINAIEIVPAGVPSDPQPPTAPGSLTFNSVTANSVTVNWTAATDNVGVTGYRISRGTTVLNTVSGLSFTDTGLTASTSYTYSVVAVDAAGNVSPASAGTIATTAGGSSSSTIRVNAGGPAYVDTAGNTWSADTGYTGGSTYVYTTNVSGTTNPTLYKTVRYQKPTDAPIAYTFALPNGDYVVRLHLSETYPGTQGIGQRVFDIDIQSVRAFEDVDVFALAGADAALVLSKNASVTNGQLKIDFLRQVENPKINAIEIVPAGPAPDTQAPTMPGSLTFNSVTSSSVTVNWSAATDNVGVTGYRISRGGTVLETVTSLSFTDTGLAPSTSYTYSIVALDAAGNASPASAGTIATTAGGSSAATIRVNAGGPAYVDTAGNTWSADTGYTGGSTYVYTTNVSGTTNPTLYKTVRYQKPTDAPISYTFAMPNGDYVVRLHLSETYPGTQSVGKRVFDIDIQSIRAFEDVDAFALAGANAALVLSKNVSVTNGQMKIDFLRQIENPKINAIEIVPAGAPSDTQAPTAPGSLTFSSVTSNSVTVNWTAATDNVAVVGYRVSRGATVLNTVAGLSFTDSALSPSTSYTYSIVALDAAGNASPARTGTIATTAGGASPVAIRVNAGGPSYVDTTGKTWAADTGFNTGKIYTTSTTVTNTSEPTLYKTERYQQPTDPTLVYTFSVPNGSYQVRLHFAEIYSGTKGAGLRVFDIDLESVRAFEDVDIFTQAGGGDKALILEKTVSVADGNLTIAFGRQVQNPKINALEILSSP